MALISCSTPPPPLPLLDTSTFLPQIREPIDEAYAAAKADSEDAQASGRVGMLLHAQKEWGLAREWLERAEALAPKEFAWAYYLALTSLELADLDAARASIERAVELDPRYLPAQLTRARMAFDAGELEQAEDLYRGLTESNPNPEAHYGLGLCLAARDDSRGAVAAFQQALDRFPSYGAALFAMSEQLRRQGWDEEADQKRKLAERFQAVEPPLEDPYLDRIDELAISAVAYIERARRETDAGNPQAALGYLEEAVDIDPSSPQALINLIALYAELERPDDAQKAYERAIAINENEAEAHFNLGVLRLMQERYEEARTAFERSIEINPQDADAHFNLGFALQGLERHPTALESYLRALEQRSAFPGAHFRAGLILFDQGRFVEAIDHLTSSLEPETESTAQHMWALAMAQGANGSQQSAIRTLENAQTLAQRTGQTELAAQIANELRQLQ